MITRRGFLGRLLAAPIAAMATRALPAPQSITPVVDMMTYEDLGHVFTSFKFHKDAFAMASPPLSMRFVRQYDLHGQRPVQRLDILYGMATVNPSFAVMVQS